MTMQHEEWTERLSDYLDGELTDGEQRGVAAHLAECSECAATLADLQAIAQAARTLEPLPPTGDLWSGIAQRIATLPAPAPVPRGWRYSFSIAQLAAAVVVIATLSAWSAWRILPGRGAGDPGNDVAVAEPPPSADAVQASFNDAEYDTAVADLEGALARGRATLDPATVAVLEDNLAIIDAAVREARQALIEDPANGFLSGYLVETRQRKLAFLRRATEIARDVN